MLVAERRFGAMGDILNGNSDARLNILVQI